MNKMAIIRKKCEECGKDFEYDEKPGYPRKYCFSCSEAKKKAYQAKSAQTSQKQPPTPTPQSAKHDVVINKTDKPHSYEFGKAGDRHKIYYNTISELKEHLTALKEAGLIIEDEAEIDKF